MNCGENPLLLAIKVRRFPSPLICVHEVAFPVSFKDTANRGKTYFHKYFSNGLICDGAEALLGHRNTIAWSNLGSIWLTIIWRGLRPRGVSGAFETSLLVVNVNRRASQTGPMSTYPEWRVVGYQQGETATRWIEPRTDFLGQTLVIGWAILRTPLNYSSIVSSNYVSRGHELEVI